MVGLLEVAYQSFNQYKKDIIAGILYGLATLLMGIIFAIPILGAFAIAYLMPRLLNWYYNKTIGNIKTDYDLAFKVWLIFGLVVHVVLIIAIILGIGMSNMLYLLYSENYFAIISNLRAMFELFIIMLLMALAVLIFTVLYAYTLYGSVLGKVNEIKIYPLKSLILVIYILVWSILLGIIAGILLLIPFIGGFLVLLYEHFFLIPILSLIAANYVLSS